MRSFLIAASFILTLTILGCPSSNNPSGPTGPTSTPTQSPTLVSTGTSTPTQTATPTSTGTSTLVSTATLTNTLTASPTATLTSTATPTSTVTLSPTPSVTIVFIRVFNSNPNLSSEPGKRLNPPLTAQIWHPGSTDVTSCPAPGMQIQAGYGTDGTNPSTWSVWIPMACNSDLGNDDFYSLQFTSPAQGTYNYAVRGRLNGGPWTYGDWDSSNPNDGYDEPVTLTVGAPTMQGQLISPSSISISTGNTTASITGRIYRAGTTDTVTNDSGAFVARVGYGLVGTDPSTWPDAQWSAASFSSDVGGEDEYVGTFTAPAAGNYEYAFRFFYVYGDQVWYFCDLDGSQNGFSSAQAGQMTVTP